MSCSTRGPLGPWWVRPRDRLVWLRHSLLPLPC
jgi:hypothetical protein